MNLSTLPSGLYTGIITARSAEVPSPADELTYSVTLNVENGTVSVDGVRSQPGSRWTDYMPTEPGDEMPNLFPFPLGHRVPVHFERQGDNFNIYIDRGEVPEFGGC